MSVCLCESAVGSPGCEHARPGAIIVCKHCGNFYQFDEELRLKPLSMGAFKALDQDFRAVLERAQGAIRRSRSN